MASPAQHPVMKVSRPQLPAYAVASQFVFDPGMGMGCMDNKNCGCACPSSSTNFVSSGGPPVVGVNGTAALSGMSEFSCLSDVSAKSFSGGCSFAKLALIGLGIGLICRLARKHYES